MKKKYIFILAFCTFFIAGCKKHEDNEDPKTKIEIDVPEKESKDLPSGYSALENLDKVLLEIKDKEFQTTAKGKVSARVAFFPYDQEVYGRTIVTKNLIFKESISLSSLKKVASQKYIKNNNFYIRKADDIKAMDDVVWNNDQPQKLSKEDFLSSYGYIPNNISVYILNKKTIKKSILSINEDNTYNIELTLDHKLSTENYKKEVKTNAESKEYPEFNSVELNININKKWQIIKVTSKEEYSIKVPLIGHINCSSKITETFSYEDITVPNDEYCNKFIK